MEVCDMINDIIISTKGPYQPFEKKINLADLASIVEEIWDDQDDEWFLTLLLACFANIIHTHLINTQQTIYS